MLVFFRLALNCELSHEFSSVSSIIFSFFIALCFVCNVALVRLYWISFFLCTLFLNITFLWGFFGAKMFPSSLEFSNLLIIEMFCSHRWFLFRFSLLFVFVLLYSVLFLTLTNNFISRLNVFISFYRETSKALIVHHLCTIFVSSSSTFGCDVCQSWMCSYLEMNK